MTDLASRDADLQRLLRECVDVFGPNWNADAAATLHEQIEAAVDVASAGGRDGLSDLLLELSVFLCSLVDLGRPPSAAAQARIASMCKAFGLAAAPVSAPRLERVAAESRVPLVILLAAAENAQLELPAEIGRRKLLVSQVDSLEDLAQEVSRRVVTVVAMSPEWLDRAAEVMAVIERAHPHALTQPGTLVVVAPGDRARRMFALRAGVDQVVEASTANGLADEIAGFVHKRRNSAFRVLIVEDDLGQAMFAQKVLGHRGMDTRVAASAEEALAMVESFRPDLCLLDLNLPDRNGIELAQLLRERPGFELVQIVFLTGELSTEARTLAVRLGADDWIVKPVRPRDLLAVIESRAERARRSSPHDAVAALGREAARGVHARRRLLGQIGGRIGEDASQERHLLVAVTPQLEAEAIVEVSWEDQAELGGEIARALRAESQVRSEVCQAETLCCLFVADSSAASQAALAAVASGLERRQWLGGTIQLLFGVAAVPLESDMSPQDAVASVMSLLRKTQQQAPRVRLQPGRSAETTPSGWPQLRELFNTDALGRAHRVSFHPLMPVRGSCSGQFMLRAEFEVALGDGHSVVPDHRAFARSAGLHLKLDQWLLARCLDRLRLSRGDMSLMVEVCPESVEDPGLAAWLAAELQRRRMPAPALTLLFGADRMRLAPGRAQRALQTLLATGVRLAIGPLTDSAVDLELVKIEGVQLLSCAPDQTTGEIPSALLSAVNEHGKVMLVSAVDDPTAATAVFRLPVHYACGLAISPPLNRPEFEFSAE